MMKRPSESRRQALRQRSEQHRTSGSKSTTRQPLTSEQAHVHAQWYVDREREPVEASGVNPRVDEIATTTDQPTFVSLPLSMQHLLPSDSSRGPAASRGTTQRATPATASQPTPRTSRLALTRIEVRAPRSARLRNAKGLPQMASPTSGSTSHSKSFDSTDESRTNQKPAVDAKPITASQRSVSSQAVLTSQPPVERRIDAPSAAKPTVHSAISSNAGNTHVGLAESQSGGRGNNSIATAIEGDFAGRRFRLDHADWIPTPHNSSVLILGTETPIPPAGRTSSPSHQITSPPSASKSDNSPASPLYVAEVLSGPTAKGPAVSEPAVSGASVTEAAVSQSQIVVQGTEKGLAVAELPSTSTTIADVIGPKSEAAASSSEPLRAAWEVDDFRWPKLSSELLLSQGSVFDQLLKAIRLRDSSARILAVTGMRPGDGRSTLSICLARWAAAQGNNTLLVDGDLLRGKLVEVSGLEFDLGWQSNATSGLSLGESLIRSTSAKLTLLPLNSDRIATAQLPGAAKQLDKLLARLRTQYDWIIVDSGTAQEMARFHLDSAPMIDVAVVVRNLQATTPQELETAQRHLVGIGIRQLAIAENFGRRSKAG